MPCHTAAEFFLTRSAPGRHRHSAQKRFTCCRGQLKMHRAAARSVITAPISRVVTARGPPFAEGPARRCRLSRAEGRRRGPRSRRAACRAAAHPWRRGWHNIYPDLGRWRRVAGRGPPGPRGRRETAGESGTAPSRDEDRFRVASRRRPCRRLRSAPCHRPAAINRTSPSLSARPSSPHPTGSEESNNHDHRQRALWLQSQRCWTR